MKSKHLLVSIVFIILLGLAIILVVLNRNTDRSLVDRLTLASLPGDQVEVGLVPEEGVILPAYYYASPGKVENRGVIFLHGLGESHEVWNEYAAKLQAENFEVMTFDFRGHGEASGTWEEFSQNDINQFTVDAQEAIHYLRDVNADMDIALIGSSLGANIAMQVAAADPSINAVVLLSPANEYHGVSIVDINAQFSRPVFYSVSDADNPSAKDTKNLYKHVQSTRKELKTFPKSGHGHKLLQNEPQLGDDIIYWLNEVL